MARAAQGCPCGLAPQSPGNGRNPLSISLNRLSNMRGEGGRRERRCDRMGGRCATPFEPCSPNRSQPSAVCDGRVASGKMIPRISSRIDLAVRARWSWPARARTSTQARVGDQLNVEIVKPEARLDRTAGRNRRTVIRGKGLRKHGFCWIWGSRGLVVPCAQSLYQL
jgi:hypothetical protein